MMRKKTIAVFAAFLFAFGCFCGILPAAAAQSSPTWKISEHTPVGTVTEQTEKVTLTAGTGEAVYQTENREITANGLQFTFCSDSQTATTHDFFKIYLRNDNSEGKGLDIRFGANIMLVVGGTFTLATVETGSNTASSALLDNAEHKITIVTDAEAYSLKIYLAESEILSAVFSPENYESYVGTRRGYAFAVSKKAETPKMSAYVKEIKVGDFALSESAEQEQENTDVTFTNGTNATAYTAENGSEITAGTAADSTTGLQTSAADDGIFSFDYQRTSSANAAATDKFVFGVLVGGEEGFRIVILWNKVQLYKKGVASPVTEKAFSGSIGGVAPNVPVGKVKLKFDDSAKTVSFEFSHNGATPVTVSFDANFGDDYAANAGTSRQIWFSAESAGTFAVTVKKVKFATSVSVSSGWQVRNEIDAGFGDSTVKTSEAEDLGGGAYRLTAPSKAGTPRVYTQETDRSDAKISFSFTANRNLVDGYDYLSFIFRAADPSLTCNTTQCFVVRVEPNLTRLMRRGESGNAKELINTPTTLLDGQKHSAEVYLKEESHTLYVCVDGKKILEFAVDAADWLASGGYGFETSGATAKIEGIVAGDTQTFPEDFDMSVFDRPAKADTVTDFRAQNNGDGVAVASGNVVNISGNTSGTGSAFYHTADTNYKDDFFSFTFKLQSEPLDNNATKLIFYMRSQTPTSPVWSKSTGVYLVLSQTVMQVIVARNNNYNDSVCQTYGLISKPLTKNQLLDGEEHSVTVRFADESGSLYVKVDDMIVQFDSKSIEAGDEVDYSYPETGGMSFVCYGGQFEIRDFVAVDSESIIQEGDTFPPIVSEVTGNTDNPFRNGGKGGCSSDAQGTAAASIFVASALLIVLKQKMI